MKNHRKTSFLLFALLVTLGITVSVTLRGHSQNQNKTASPNQDNLKKAAEDFYTITDYDSPEPADPQKRALRQARGKRYGVPAQKGVDPKRFMITEKKGDFLGGPSSHAPAEPAIPIVQSDAVIIGEITGAQAFLSEDKTAIYSEFKVRIEEVLKDGSPASLTHDSEIVAERSGGAVRFASGKITRVGFEGKPLPRIGRKYLLFLKYSAEGQDFILITAYELRAGQVYPLDGLTLEGKALWPYEAYQKYKGADEASFLNEVRQAIATAGRG